MHIKLLEGRDHFVLPVVMIKEGVHAGSQGPLFYSGDELRATAFAWNGRPLVVYHPDMYYSGLAGNPHIFNNQKVGTVFNVQYHRNGKLIGEAWIDMQRVEVVDLRVLNSIRANQPVEVSTGLHVDRLELRGYFNGRQYSAVASNFRPDHLAILPDRRGACSLNDGCGLLRAG